MASREVPPGPYFHGTRRVYPAPGVSASIRDRYGAHSLRAGLATSAAEAGVSERAIMNQITSNAAFIRQIALSATAVSLGCSMARHLQV